MKEYIPRTQDEADYLKKYDPTKYYPTPTVTADLSIYAYDKKTEKLDLLLITRGGYPYKGFRAVPGGFVNYDEPIEDAAARELLEETGLKGIDPLLFCVLSDPKRDPRQRVITPEFLALADKDELSPQAGDDAKNTSWFTVTDFTEKKERFGSVLIESYSLSLTYGEETLNISAKQSTDYSKKQPVRSFSLLNDADLAFDHAEAIIKSFISLRKRLMYTDIICGALSSSFTLKEYKAVLKAAFLSEDIKPNDNFYVYGESISVLPR